MDDEPAQSDVADTDHPLTITPSGLKCCFESYDTDSDGHITQDEFQAALILKLDAKDDVASHIGARCRKFSRNWTPTMMVPSTSKNLSKGTSECTR